MCEQYILKKKDTVVIKLDFIVVQRSGFRVEDIMIFYKDNGFISDVELVEEINVRGQ